MKYCQKCRAMLTDETEVCPSCGTKQLPEEEFKKKKKQKKTALTALLAVIALIIAVIAAILILGKEPKPDYTDEEFTENVTDTELIAQFAAYIATVMPTVWESSGDDIDLAVEYYQQDFPDVAAGYEQLRELQPVAGTVETVTLDGAVKSEAGRYKLCGELVCTERKVNYALVLGASAYVDALSFELKEETAIQKAREAILKVIPLE